MRNNTQQGYTFYSKMSLSKKTKYFTYFVLFAVGMALLGIAFALSVAGANNFVLLFLFASISLTFFLTYRYSPTGVGIKNNHLHIVRAIGPIVIPTSKIRFAKEIENIKKETGIALRTFGSGGVWGWFGFFWSKKWGHFKLHITSEKNNVLLETTEEKKIVISPDDREVFLQALKKSNNSINITNN